MTILVNTPDVLSVRLELPRVLLWSMAVPVIVAVFVGVSEVLGGSVFSGIILIAGVGGLGGYGLLRVSERAELRLDARAGTVQLRRSTLFATRGEDFILAHLDSAELSTRSRNSAGTIDLVFTDTRPATRIALTGWGVSGGGVGPLATAINDWLAQARGEIRAAR